VSEWEHEGSDNIEVRKVNGSTEGGDLVQPEGGEGEVRTGFQKVTLSQS
jgi:hypothetical protein